MARPGTERSARLRYERQGSGPTVVFLHGLPTNGRLWDLVVPELTDGFSCVVVDLPGFGDSPSLPTGASSPDAYADALEEVRRSLGADSWHLVAHDAGSVIAAHYAARYGDRVDRLLLCSAPLFPEHRIPAIVRTLRIPLLGVVIAWLWVNLLWDSTFGRSMARPDPRALASIEAFGRRFRGWRGARDLVRSTRWGDPAVVLRRTAELLPDITAPTLLLHGERDPFIPGSFAQRAAREIEHAELRLLPYGHLLPLEAPGELSDAVMTFFAQPNRST